MQCQPCQPLTSQGPEGDHVAVAVRYGAAGTWFVTRITHQFLARPRTFACFVRDPSPLTL